MLIVRTLKGWTYHSTFTQIATTSPVRPITTTTLVVSCFNRTPVPIRFHSGRRVSAHSKLVSY